MRIQLPIPANKLLRRTMLFIIALAILFGVIAIVQDLLEARFHGSAFYFSESFLFSSFWWLFIPVLYVQFMLARKKYASGIIGRSLLLTTPILFHLIAFPVLVWIISRLFYENTFRLQQTFQYTLSEHLYLLLFAYSIPVLAYQYFRSNNSGYVTAKPDAAGFQTSLMVSEGNKHTAISVADIVYFTANSPYINIHHQQKTYLHNASLKAVAEKLDPEVFVRIHKSTIININFAKSYTSRLNGDYDLTLKDGTGLRVSRNYVGAFKAVFHAGHRLTVN